MLPTCLIYINRYRSLFSQRLLVAFLGGFLGLATAQAQSTDELALLPDSLRVKYIQVMSEQKPNFFRRVLNYYKNGRTNGKNKRVDLGILPGPHYSYTTGFGLGVVATATYRAEQADTLLPYSNASLLVDATTKGYFTATLKGVHIFPHERYRLDYRVQAQTSATQIWGAGYEMCDQDAHETDHRLQRIDASARFLFRLAPNTYLGPLLHYQIKAARSPKPKVPDFDPFLGQPLTQRAYTVGASFTYDSRDFIPNAYKGVFLQLDQTFTPRGLGNGNFCYSSTELTLSAYRQVWRGGTLCAEGHAVINYGNVPWAYMAQVGSNDRMRGYFEGRYRDKNLLEAQVELRQRVKGRHGIAVWAGAAEVFPDFNGLLWRRILPNGGVGYRWEFKPRINVRIDAGLTRQGVGFIFALQEAF